MRITAAGYRHNGKVSGEKKTVIPDQRDATYSSEINDIISHRMSWQVRYGLVLFATAFALVLSATFFIPFPDTVRAPARIMAANMPKLVVAKQEGSLAHLAIGNGQIAKSGQLLGIIRSTANPDHVFSLERWLDTIAESQHDLTNGSMLSKALSYSDLGEIQPAYQSFRTAAFQLVQAMEGGYFVAKRRNLLGEMRLIDNMQGHVTRQEKMFLAQDSLQRILLQANQLLEAEKVIAPMEVNKEAAVKLSKEQSVEQIETEMIGDSASHLAKNGELLDLEKAVFDLKQGFQTAYFNLRASISAWKDKYVLIAPEEGTVQYVFKMQKGILVKPGTEMFYIVPRQEMVYAEINAPQENLGKLMESQQVNIFLHSYPYQEYGIIKGKISYIPQVPYRDTSFLITVDLPDGLRSTYQKNLPFKNNLIGEAEVVVGRPSLAEKIMFQFRGLFHRR